MAKRLNISPLWLWIAMFPSLLYAEAGWTGSAYIAELVATNQFRFFVMLNVSENPSGCRNKSVFYRDHSASGSEQMFRILLEAASSHKRVRVFVTGNCDINGYSEISSVSITP